MSQTARHDFSTANPHALAVILEASETKTIIASRDIFDLSGIKLWARDQPVSAALQRRLMDRKLRNPLEACLIAEDGVTAASLVRGAEELVERDGPLRPLLAKHADAIVREAAHLPMHSVAQLLLTAGQASRPESFDHSLQAMALAGALMLQQGGRTAEVRIAMLAGLLHDLGEMYIDPQCGEAEAERGLDFVSYQQLVVHPHVGKLLLAQLTNYPEALARAVGEHHERLDGSGYPHALSRDAVSPLGRMLAVVEASLAVLRLERPSLARASVALRVVPGEFDLEWLGHVASAAREAPQLQPQQTADEVRQRLQRLVTTLATARDCTAALLPEVHTPTLKDAITLASHLLGRLRTGLAASGLWHPSAVTEQDLGEIEAVEDELRFRLWTIDRAARLRAGSLPDGDATRLEQLGDALRGQALQ